MSSTLIGLFSTSDTAQTAVRELVAAGVDRAKIGTDASDLAALGVPAADATLYAQAVGRGSAIVTVQADEDQETTVARILDRDGVLDVGAGLDKIEIVEESLVVGKREVESGGLRVRSFVTERPVSEQVTLREEHVDVTRTAVDRPAAGAAFQEETIELRETAEVPVVAKEARVVEEVHLNKTATERVETVTETVRRTDVEVVPITGSGASVSSTSTDAAFRTHLETTSPGASYERHAPAYAYGRDLANDPIHGASDFEAGEPAHREAWERQNPGTWNEFKSSVRHAYESVKAKV